MLLVCLSCGHLYHVQCLQQTVDCGLPCTSEQQQQWSCYKCSTTHRERGPQYTMPKSHCTSLAQEGRLDIQQEQSWDQLHCLYKGPSRLSILAELSHHHHNKRTGIIFQGHPAQEGFSLKLSPPPVLEE
ncbi:vacuolar protein sorting-associated protein 8 homolog isoform X2 [Syngnathoides biaculeatus]|uniref:vacuolar protein sorting-associated protein 8 homolog isoform X2 n=1 Tax=Syngnathoides biaculeatus TaxID=300417 RepID=UPI002ADD7536|nr:vacuolar protein sorting-associated protein 8 homolog isoform X2 [Syngnathoides biaculeatus]